MPDNASDLPFEGLAPQQAKRRVGRPTQSPAEIRRTRIGKEIASNLVLIDGIQRHAPHMRHNVCPLCLEPNPKFFDVPDGVWAYYIRAGGARWAVICLPCWDRIVDRIDGGHYARTHNGAAAPL